MAASHGEDFSRGNVMWHRPVWSIAAGCHIPGSRSQLFFAA